MKKAGFSLVEILIATTILLVIVMMVSMVFQQQSAAFQSGEDRVKGQAAIRNIVGMIVRDLSLAVDSASITNLPASVFNDFKSDEIKFFATTGEAGVSVNGDDNANDTSVLQYINYSLQRVGNNKIRVKRKVTDYRLKANWSWEKGNSVETTLNNEDYLESLSFTKNPTSATTFPESVTVKAVYAGSSHTGAISGWSEGPSKNKKAKDDIYVGAKFQP